MRNGTSLAGDAVRSSIEAAAMRQSVYPLTELQNLNRARTELSGGRSWGRGAAPEMGAAMASGRLLAFSGASGLANRLASPARLCGATRPAYANSTGTREGHYFGPLTQKLAFF
jgi:hypothetical protein